MLSELSPRTSSATSRRNARTSSSAAKSASDAPAGVDPVVPEGASDADFAADDEVRAFLRDVAEDVRGDSSESKQLSAVLYRVSDLYDSDEETSPEEIYLNVRHIMRIKSEGGLRR